MYNNNHTHYTIILSCSSRSFLNFIFFTICTRISIYHTFIYQDIISLMVVDSIFIVEEVVIIVAVVLEVVNVVVVYRHFNLTFYIIKQHSLYSI